MRKSYHLFLGLLFCMSAHAYDFESGGIYYDITSSTTVSVTNNEDMEQTYSGEVVIPETVNHGNNSYTVTAVGKAFIGCSALTSVTLPNSITSIGDFAFASSGLSSISIPDNVASIGFSAFENSSIHSIVIPDNVKNIGDRAFCSCSWLTSVTLPNSITSIGYGVFSGCHLLTSLTIPYSVTSIGESAFSGCTQLVSLSIPDNVESIGDYAFQSCQNLSSITFGNGVTYIGKNAFYGCYKLTSVVIPENVTSLGGSAFESCINLESVMLSHHITVIKPWTFRGCDRLESVFIPKSVIDISPDAFDCPLTVSDENPRYAAAEGVLFNKDFSELIRYPKKKTEPDYTIPNSVVVIKPRAFEYCKNLKSITIPDCVTSIEEEAFYDSGLTSIVIPESITELKYAVFGECYSLQSVTIPNSVTHIGEGVFAMCDNLTSIMIPASVTSIAVGAFYKCNSLADIYLLNTVPVSISDDMFTSDIYSNTRLHVPQGKATDYRNADGWKNFVNIVDDAVSSLNFSYHITDAKIFANGDNVIIENARVGEPVLVYDESGKLIKTAQIVDKRLEMQLPINRIYIIKCANKVEKIRL